MKDIFDLIGRAAIAFIFLYDGFDSFWYFKETKATMIEYNLSWNTELLLVSGIIILFLGGILVLIGYRSSFGAMLLLLYWLPVTFILHSFWDDPEPERRFQAILFMKNIAIAGGLLMILVNGSGKFSIKRLFATARVPGA